VIEAQQVGKWTSGEMGYEFSRPDLRGGVDKAGVLISPLVSSQKYCVDHNAGYINKSSAHAYIYVMHINIIIRRQFSLHRFLVLYDSFRDANATV
jgi:hypothetical protein